MSADSLVAGDEEALDLLVSHDSMSISELTEALGVTATAVRQRLDRLMARGFVGREARRAGRGRPQHRYHVTPVGRRKVGVNLDDFAVAAWEAIGQIESRQLRRELMEEISSRLIRRYATQIEGVSVEEKMKSLAALFAQRHIPYSVDRQEGLPVLTALTCPYPDLAEEDRNICSLERRMFSGLLGQSVQQEQCRLDGDRCCSFKIA